jgi:hypothetical protein
VTGNRIQAVSLVPDSPSGAEAKERARRYPEMRSIGDSDVINMIAQLKKHLRVLQEIATFLEVRSTEG